MSSKKYNIIYADPPWRYDFSCSRAREIERHYETMTLPDICALPIKALTAPDATLFLWATWPKLEQAMKVIPDWGFTYKTVGFVWVKEYRDGSPVLGMGYWARSNTEFCLFATKGKPQRADSNVSQLVFALLGEHSAKPPEVRDRIVQLMGDLPRIELFARQPEPTLFGDTMAGWDVWGNEVESDIEL